MELTVKSNVYLKCYINYKKYVNGICVFKGLSLVKWLIVQKFKEIDTYLTV